MIDLMAALEASVAAARAARVAASEPAAGMPEAAAGAGRGPGPGRGRARSASTQDGLNPTLGLDEPASTSCLPRRVRPMVAADGPPPFDDPAYLFEPWWPGTASSRSSSAAGCDCRRRSWWTSSARSRSSLTCRARLMRLMRSSRASSWCSIGRPAGSRSPAAGAWSGAGQRLGRPAFVATDLLWASGRRLTRVRFASRRQRLGALLRTSDWCTASRGYLGEGRTLAAAARDLGFASLSAHRLDAPYRAGDAGDAWVRVSIRESGGDPVRLPPILAVFRRLPLGDAG